MSRTNKVAIDCGNYNFKLDIGESFSSTFTIEEGVDILQDEQYINFEGVNYLIGKGSRDLTYNKVEKTYIPLLLFAINKSLEAENSLEKVNLVDLAIGCPVENVKGLREKFINDLVGRDFLYKANGNVERTIRIEHLLVNGESISAYYSLKKSEREGRCIIFDIGGLSINISSFENGRLEKYITYPKGILHLQEEIRKGLNSEGENYTLEDIGVLMHSSTGISNLESYYNKFIEAFLNEVKISFKLNLYNNVYLSGGGSILLENTIKYKVPAATIVEDPLFANVKGNKKLLLLQARKWSE